LGAMTRSCGYGVCARIISALAERRGEKKTANKMNLRDFNVEIAS
jgi:hypothetical protein